MESSAVALTSAQVKLSSLWPWAWGHCSTCGDPRAPGESSPGGNGRKSPALVPIPCSSVLLC